MRRLPLLCAFLLLTGCYDSRFGERSGGEEPEPATATIAQLRQLYAGTTFVIATDVVVSGRVNTSDAEENFYRTFCVEEDGAGLEVMAGIDHLHNDFPPGSRVTLRLKGLALGESRGILQVGRKPAAGSGFATDYLGSKAALDAAVSRTGEAPQPVAPALLTIAELTPKRCGTLVRIDGLSYTPEDLTPGTWAGYKRFTDAGGAEIYTYVRNYAGFAGEEVPAGKSCSLTGNDFYGEFYKTLVVEDASGGISLLIDGTRLAFDYPVGAAVSIFCNGLTLGDYGGKIQLGTAPDGDYGVGRIPREELRRYLRRNPDKDRRPRPAVCTFDAIGPRQTDTYVCFEGVRFTEAGPWCDTDPETSEPQTSERTLTDAQGRTFRVRTLGTCAYATEPVPQGTGSVYGIIDYFNGKYTLRVSERRVEFANAAGLPRAYPSTGRYSAPKPTK